MLTYTPDPHFTGADVLTYTLDDGHRGLEDMVVVIHVVKPPANLKVSIMTVALPTPSHAFASDHLAAETSVEVLEAARQLTASLVQPGVVLC